MKVNTGNTRGRSKAKTRISFNFLKDGWTKPYVLRREVGEFTGGLLSASLMNNLDCSGKGPSERFKVGKHVAYPVGSLIAWLESRSRN